MFFAHPRLAFGSALKNEKDAEKVANAGVTHVINLRREDNPNLQWFDSLWVPFKDDKEPRPRWFFNQILKFAKKALSSPRSRLLVMCHYGLSRSPSVVHFLLRAMGMSPKEATQRIHHARPQATVVPNYEESGGSFLKTEAKKSDYVAPPKVYHGKEAMESFANAVGTAIREAKADRVQEEAEEVVESDPQGFIGIQDELAEHGTKGMKWGAKKGGVDKAAHSKFQKRHDELKAIDERAAGVQDVLGQRRLYAQTKSKLGPLIDDLDKSAGKAPGEHGDRIRKSVSKARAKFDAAEVSSSEGNVGEAVYKQESALMQVHAIVDEIGEMVGAPRKSWHESGTVEVWTREAAHKLQAKTDFQGLPISIENKVGSVRKGVDKKTGEPWETKMKNPYGYIRHTEGADGDHLDCFIGPNKKAKYAYVIHTKKSDTDKYDEDKAMLGFDTPEQARRAFLRHYDDPHYYGSMTSIPMSKFKKAAASTFEDPRPLTKETTTGDRINSWVKQASEAGTKGMKWGQKKARPKGKGMNQASKAFSVEARGGVKRDMHKVSQGQNINTDSFGDHVFNKDNEGLVRIAYDADSGELFVPDAGMTDLDHGDYMVDVSGDRNPDLASVRGTLDLKDGSTILYDMTEEVDTIAQFDKPGDPLHSKRVGHKVNSNLNKALASTFYVNGKKMKHSTEPIANVLGFRSSVRESRPLMEGMRALMEAKRKKKPVLYYARPLQKYGTAAEAGDIDYLKELFPSHRVQALVSCDKRRRGMDYYHRKVEAADMVVVAPFRKNKLTAGVWSEASHALKSKVPVKMLRRGKFRTIRSVSIKKKGGRNSAGEFGLASTRKKKRKRSN